MAIEAVEIRVATLTLDATDIDALFATPITIVDAPGAGLVAVPLAIVPRLQKSASTWNASRNLVVRYNGDTTNLIQTGTTILLGQAHTDQLYSAACVSTHTPSNNFNPANKALEVTWETGDVGGGPANTTVKLWLLYRLDSYLYS
jgi:hypothetical protein